MPTIVCGLECGIVTSGGAAALTNRHWSSIVGTPVIETTVVKDGARSVSFNAPSTYFELDPLSMTVCWLACDVNIDVLPTTNPIRIFQPNNTGVSDLLITIGTTGVVNATKGASSVNGPTIAANTWWGLEVQDDVSVTPSITKWRTRTPTGVWTDWANVSLAQAISNYDNGILVGQVNSLTTGSKVRIDNIRMGWGTTPGADWSDTRPRDGKVLRLRPTSDGVHSFTAGDFGYDTAGANVLTSDTGVWAFVDDDDQTSITDGILIRQIVINAAGRVAVRFADTVETNIGAVAVTSTHHSSTAAANTMSLRVSDNNWAAETAVWALLSCPTTTAQYLHKVLAAPASGGAWTMEKLNSTEMRWGYSDDTTPLPYLDSGSIEYEVLTSLPTMRPIYPQLLPS